MYWFSYAPKIGPRSSMDTNKIFGLFSTFCFSPGESQDIIKIVKQQVRIEMFNNNFALLIFFFHLTDFNERF